MTESIASQRETASAKNNSNGNLKSNNGSAVYTTSTTTTTTSQNLNYHKYGPNTTTFNDDGRATAGAWSWNKTLAQYSVTAGLHGDGGGFGGSNMAATYSVYFRTYSDNGTVTGTFSTTNSSATTRTYLFGRKDGTVDTAEGIIVADPSAGYLTATITVYLATETTTTTTNIKTTSQLTSLI